MSKVFIDECHAQNILQRMWEQCETEQFCDVVLIAGTEETRIPAHRSVLCASTDYFKTMFTAPFKENTTREAKVPSVDGEILKSLVEYSYLGRLEIEEEIVEKLLVTAHSLLLDTVVEACGNFLAEKLQPSNCLGIWKIAESYQMESLSKNVEEFCLKNFVELYKTEEFLSLMSAEQFAQLLGNDELRVPYEEDVFKSLMRWLEYDPVEREQHKEALLKGNVYTGRKTNLYINCISSMYNEAMEWNLVPKCRQLNTSISGKPRRRIDQFLLMAITKENDKMRILYHSPQELKWMKRLDSLEDRTDFGVAIIENDLFIVGGRAQNAILNSVTCLNLQTMVLKEVNPMSKPRANVAVAAFKGLLYAVGGHDGKNYLNSAERWDPDTNCWSVVAPMSYCRKDCGIGILDNKLYVIGGYNTNGALNSVECYDAQTNNWTTIEPMIEKHKLPGVAVTNGMLYVMGGISINTVECYNPKKDKWTVMYRCLSDNTNLRNCIALYDKILILYDDRVEEYNPVCKITYNNTASIRKLNDVYYTFLYSGLLLESEFVEN